MARASSRSALQALSLDAELAGAAMACRYSCSDEYEAALIAERRRAGAYGRPLRRQPDVWLTLLAACIVVLLSVLG